MSNIITNRSELVFLYDVKDANPNGDPLDENKPRIDEETGINLVTDVRLKRTIRDYLYNFKKEDIFVREISDEEGHIQDAKLRASDFLKHIPSAELEGKTLQQQKEIATTEILKRCIDVRLFGATIPLELKVKKGKKTEKPKEDIKEQTESKEQTSSLTFTGPVQFKIGRSLHKVYIKHFRGTGAFASKKGAEQKTFREEDFLFYSLINFYGIINENAAKDTKLTDDDVKFLLDGIWNGTKNLISRSKVGQVPRLLIKVNYKENNYHIGELNSMISLVKEVPDEELRDISQVRINLTKIIDVLKSKKDLIQNVEYQIDDRAKFELEGKEIAINEAFKNSGIQALQLSL